MCKNDLQVVPGPPHADLKRRALDEWLRNPFLDDDEEDLALRLSAPASDVVEAMVGLCESGFLQPSGRSGYRLDCDFGDVSSSDIAEGKSATVSFSAAAVGDPMNAAEVAIPPEFSDFGKKAAEDPLAREISEALNGLLPREANGGGKELLDALPFGVAILRETGSLEMANRKASQMLGIPCEQVDGATFEIATGVNPLTALCCRDPIVFSLTEPLPVEVTLQPRDIAGQRVVLILFRDVSLQEEVAQISAHLQEELYENLQDEMIGPLMMIEQFLERPQLQGLGEARVAMEQINSFLRDFFLRDSGSQAPDSPAADSLN
ncbi:MAG: PAS domain-containing protein [Candidatus Latescibacterota bacterium]|nr:PAS domain-containing protein [Candidatus Latescibacterota bacterium]